MFKYEVGDICMIKNAPEAYDELNGWVVKLTQASLLNNAECWYCEEEILHKQPIPENWLWKFGMQVKK